MKIPIRCIRTLAAAAIVACFLPATLTQAGGFGGGGFGGAGYGGGGYGGGGYAGGAAGIDAGRIEQALLGRVQEQVGITDEEWSVIEPKLWKVVSLQAQTGSGATGALVNAGRNAGAGGRGGYDINGILTQALNNGNPIPVLQLQQELQDMLGDPASTDFQISAKLEQYRSAMTQAKTQLAAAQEDLQGVLTLRQEAWMLELGYLEYPPPPPPHCGHTKPFAAPARNAC